MAEHDNDPIDTEIEKEIFDFKDTALSNVDLQNFCNKNNLPFNLCELSQLNNCKDRYAFIFTGNKKDEFNNGTVKHWLLADGNLIFDSYGVNDYKLPSNFSLVKNHPKQLQEYNSVICGEYCLAFLDFLIKNQNIPSNQLGNEFSDEYGFTTNRRTNDEIVHTWYEKNK